MLEIDCINVFYGKNHVLKDVSLNIKEGEIVALIGSNGAGKSTLLKTISGALRPKSGTISFLGRRIDNLPIHVISSMGIAHIPEGGHVFRDMSVFENLEMGAYSMGAWKQKLSTINRVYEIFPILKERSAQLARTLSGGEQQMLAMGRGLMSKPRLCVFDEPSYGLSPLLVKEVFRVIKSLREQGITILLTEQNVKTTLEISDRAYVMENGRIVIEDRCNVLINSEHIRKAYLGL